MKTPLKQSLQHGFSLVELLVVIAVIGIIAAIAIPNISNITGSAQTAADRRNAQNVASVASAARAAGYTNDWVSPTAAITTLTTGVTVTNPRGSTDPKDIMTFRVDAISTAQIPNIITYLDTNATTGDVVFVPNP